MANWNTWRTEHTDVIPDLSDANLYDVDLSSAYLYNTNLSGAELLSTDLSGADLIGADLSDVNLIDTNLSVAYLHSVNLEGTRFINVNLSRTKGIHYYQFGGIGLYNTSTIYIHEQRMVHYNYWIGSVDDFEELVRDEYGDNEHAHDYMEQIAIIRSKVQRWDTAA